VNIIVLDFKEINIYLHKLTQFNKASANLLEEEHRSSEPGG
jgi:hypothetical protein